MNNVVIICIIDTLEGLDLSLESFDFDDNFSIYYILNDVNIKKELIEKIQFYKPEIEINICISENENYNSNIDEIISSKNYDNCDVLILNGNYSLAKNKLRQLQNLLYKAEKNGFVSPRSNISLISKIPTSINSNYDFHISNEKYESMKNMIPEFYILPFADPNIFMVKNKIIRTYNLFKSNNTFVEIILKANQYGYSSLCDNKVFIECFYSVSLINTIDAVIHDYPFMKNQYDYFMHHELSFCENYADIICEKNIKKKILLSYYFLPPVYNGTSEYSLQILYYLIKNFSEKYDIFVLVNKDADNFFKLSEKYKNILYVNDIKGKYDIVFFPIQLIEQEHLKVVLSCAIKIVLTVLDVIMFRCQYITGENLILRSNILKALKFSDKIITISDFSKEDISEYFNFKEKNKIKTVLLGVDELSNKKNYKLPFENYILVVGNNYFHKCLNEIYEILKTVMDRNFIFIGYDNINDKKNILSLKSGLLENEFVDYLYQNCDCLIFPSGYEGFGLPVIRAVKFNRPVILHNNVMNNEIKSLCKEFDNLFYLFDDFNQIYNILKNVNYKIEKKNNKVRNWDDVIKDIESVFEEAINQEISLKIVKKRFKFLKNIYENEIFCQSLKEKYDDIVNSVSYKIIRRLTRNRFIITMYSLLKKIIIFFKLTK